MDLKDKDISSGLGMPPVAPSGSPVPLGHKLGALTRLRIGDFVLNVGNSFEARAFDLRVEDASHLLASVTTGAATVMGSGEVARLITAGEGFLFSGEMIEQVFARQDTLFYVLEISDDVVARRQTPSSRQVAKTLLSGAITGGRGIAINNCLGLVVRMLEERGRGDAESLAIALLDTIVDMKLAVDRPQAEPTAISSQVVPGAVRRAIRYIHLEAVNGIRPCDVAEHAGTSLRSLQNGFAKFVGLTPAIYILRTRLNGVRQGLEDGSFNSVGDAARHWGFHSPSHFSQRYLEAFGEKPSHTKRGR